MGFLARIWFKKFIFAEILKETEEEDEANLYKRKKTKILQKPVAKWTKGKCESVCTFRWKSGEWIHPLYWISSPSSEWWLSLHCFYASFWVTRNSSTSKSWQLKAINTGILTVCTFHRNERNCKRNIMNATNPLLQNKESKEKMQSHWTQSVFITSAICLIYEGFPIIFILRRKNSLIERQYNRILTTRM